MSRAMDIVRKPESQPMEPAVSAVGLGKRYGRGTWGLRRCSFDVPPGRVVGLVGPNGAGKTTLINLVAGLSRPTEGTVRIAGHAPTARRGPAGGTRVAYVAQDKPLYDNLRVRDMLGLAARLNHVWDPVRAAQWLDRFDVPRDRHCGRLSGGQQAQVALAVALGSCPDLLLLDEPLANLDPLVRADVVAELLTIVGEHGLTIVMSTHVVAELHGTVDFLVLLAAGAVVLDGDVDELLHRHAYLSGPPAERPPIGEVVRATHSAAQSTFLVRDGSPLPEVGAQRWSVSPVTLEQLLLDYLRADRASAKEAG